MTQTKKVLLTLACAITCATGCKKERRVEMTLETAPRDGQIVQDDYIELQEGQAMGVRVVALKKNKIRPKWSVEGRSEDPSVLRVQPAAGEEDKEDGQLFVFSAPEAGRTQLQFRLKGKEEVFVDANIVERPDWEPTVEPGGFGGAGSD